MSHENVTEFFESESIREVGNALISTSFVIVGPTIGFESSRGPAAFSSSPRRPPAAPAGPAGPRPAGRAAHN